MSKYFLIVLLLFFSTFVYSSEVSIPGRCHNPSGYTLTPQAACLAIQQTSYPATLSQFTLIASYKQTTASSIDYYCRASTTQANYATAFCTTTYLSQCSQPNTWNLTKTICSSPAVTCSDGSTAETLSACPIQCTLPQIRDAPTNTCYTPPPVCNAGDHKALYVVSGQFPAAGTPPTLILRKNADGTESVTRQPSCSVDVPTPYPIHHR